MIDLLRSKLPRSMDVAPLRDAYPAGDEFILVYDVLGRVIPPGGIPLAVGAVVMNVETAMNVAHAGRPAGHREVPLRRRGGGRAGHAPRAGGRHPGPVRGRGRRADRADANYIVGGVMMGYLEDEPRRAGRQDHRRRDRAARRPRRRPPPAAGLAADRPHRPQRLRPVQLLHRALPALAAGPSDRAAPGDAEPGVQPGRRGQRRSARSSAASATCAASTPAPKTSTRRTSARRTSAAWRPRSSAGRTRRSTPSGRSCTWPTARRRCGG